MTLDIYGNDLTNFQFWGIITVVILLVIAAAIQKTEN